MARKLLLPVAALLLWHATAMSQTVVSGPSEGDIVFKLYAEHGPDSQVELINGVPADKNAWQTVVNALLTKPGVVPKVTCTGVFIGPGVFLTAAHCFDAGPGRALRDGVWVNVGNQNLQASCQISDEYVAAVKAQVWKFVKPRVSADYALCSFTLTSETPTSLVNLPSENVDVSTPLASNVQILLTGYGCTSPKILKSPDAADVDLGGLLRIGDVTITTMPASGVADANNFVVVRSPLKSAPALCPGDSGGPVMTGATEIKQDVKRRVRGLNSSVQLDDDGGGNFAISRVVPLDTPTFQRFSQTWLDQHQGRTICGLHGTEGFLPCRE